MPAYNLDLHEQFKSPQLRKRAKLQRAKGNVSQ